MSIAKKGAAAARMQRLRMIGAAAHGPNRLWAWSMPPRIAAVQISGM